MFGHRFHRLAFVGAKSNAFPISEQEPLVKANFPDDVLGHFRASDSERIASYAGNIAGLLTAIRPQLRSMGSGYWPATPGD